MKEFFPNLKALGGVRVTAEIMGCGSVGSLGVGDVLLAFGPIIGIGGHAAEGYGEVQLGNRQGKPGSILFLPQQLLSVS